MAQTTRNKQAATKKTRVTRRPSALVKRWRIWRRFLLWAGVVLPLALFALSFALHFIPGYTTWVHPWLFWAAEQPHLRQVPGLEGLWGYWLAYPLVTLLQYLALTIVYLLLMEGERLLRRDTSIPGV